LHFLEVAETASGLDPSIAVRLASRGGTHAAGLNQNALSGSQLEPKCNQVEPNPITKPKPCQDDTFTILPMETALDSRTMSLTSHEPASATLSTA
jgi:hypothetical protein